MSRIEPGDPVYIDADAAALERGERIDGDNRGPSDEDIVRAIRSRMSNERKVSKRLSNGVNVQITGVVDDSEELSALEFLSRLKAKRI